MLVLNLKIAAKYLPARSQWLAVAWLVASAYHSCERQEFLELVVQDGVVSRVLLEDLRDLRPRTNRQS